MQRGERLRRLQVAGQCVGTAVEQRGMGVVAEILDQQQAGGFVGGDDLGRGQADAGDVARDGHEGPDILRRRRIHQQRRAWPTA